jgi:hypothetical protein
MPALVLYTSESDPDNVARIYNLAEERVYKTTTGSLSRTLRSVAGLDRLLRRYLAEWKICISWAYGLDELRDDIYVKAFVFFSECTRRLQSGTHGGGQFAPQEALVPPWKCFFIDMNKAAGQFCFELDVHFGYSVT